MNTYVQGVVSIMKKTRKYYCSAAYFGLFTDMLSLVVCILNIYLMEEVTDYSISRGIMDGFIFLSQFEHNRNDPLSRLFPVFTRCTIYPYGKYSKIK